MRILALDIGGGTQDILLFDSSLPLENCVKLILPSPTVLVAQRLEQALAQRQPILLTGVNMGGGPSTSALKHCLEAGVPVHATPPAAQTFDDDLSVVESWGVKLVSPDEAAQMQGVAQVQLRDIDFPALTRGLGTLGLKSGLDGLAVAALDHGAAPPGVSDRLFRFQHLERQVAAKNDVASFAYLAQELPDYLTRLKAIAASVDQDLPLLLMDTGAAAALGALEDRVVRKRRRLVVLNLGNFHTLGFHLRGTAILGLFEHHTGQLPVSKLDSMVQRLVAGDLGWQEVYDDGGHGALVVKKAAKVPFVAVTGPRRTLMLDSTLNPYPAAPHGDMMLSGCFGLVRAFAQKVPAWREEIEKSLGV